MLHRSLLPQHGRWASYLRRLRYVVLDECHTYRGLFGSHVALLLRRLLRICARYGARPTIVLASATVADPAAFATRLVGREVVAVSDDGSPAAGRTVALWEPPLLDELTGENGAPVRRSAGAESARMLADLVIEGARTLAFVRSRRGAELTALGAQRVLAEVEPALVARVSPYRGGYLPEERRALEAALVRGDLLGVATTNALELGVDIAGLDAVVVAGFPGTRASFWQQAGRAGRGRDEALVVLVARDDPLDTYLVHHPDALLGAPVEGCVLDPTNPYVLAPHLACAAAELPLTEADVDALGGPAAAAVLAELVADGVLRRRPTGWFWPSSAHGPPGRWTCAGPGRGRWRWSRSTRAGCSARWRAPPRPRASIPARCTCTGARATSSTTSIWTPARPGARRGTGLANGRPSTADVAVVRVTEHRDHGAVRVSFGEVSVTTQVTAYQRRTPDGVVLETVPLDMPAQTLATRAVWYDSTTPRCSAPGLPAARIPAPCTPPSTPRSGCCRCSRPATAGTSAGCRPRPPAHRLRDRLRPRRPPGRRRVRRARPRRARRWLTATRAAIVDCECRAGCPSCVQSPKCGNGNAPLDKAGAVTVLDVVLDAVRGRS